MTEEEQTQFQSYVEYVQNRVRLTYKDMFDKRSFLKIDGLSAAKKLMIDPQALVESATDDPGAFDELRAAIAWLVDRDKTIPDAARVWLAGFLREQIKPPKPIKISSLPESGKQVFIWDTVRLLSLETGMNKTRGEAANTVCACDVVAAAFAKMNLTPMTLGGIRKVYFKEARRREEEA